MPHQPPQVPAPRSPGAIERRLITAMFADLVGSTALATGLDAGARPHLDWADGQSDWQPTRRVWLQRSWRSQKGIESRVTSRAAVARELRQQCRQLHPK